MNNRPKFLQSSYPMPLAWSGLRLEEMPPSEQRAWGWGAWILNLNSNTLMFIAFKIKNKASLVAIYPHRVACCAQ